MASIEIIIMIFGIRIIFYFGDIMKKIRGVLIVILTICCISLFSACGRKATYEFEQESGKICTIEIVEVEFLPLPDTGIQFKALAFIENVEAFLSDFNRVTCYSKGALGYQPSGVSSGDIGIKVTYMDGEYEVIAQNAQSKYLSMGSEMQFVTWADRFSFDEEMFNNLLDKYTPPLSYSLLRDKTMVSGIEIVELGEYNSEMDGMDTAILTKIEHRDEFINNFLSVPCRPLGRSKRMEKGLKAIKVSYSSGEYEIIAYNSRVTYVYQEYLVENDNGTYEKHDYYNLELWGPQYGGYLFDQATFNAFLQQYLNG